ncbi:MAG TPA: ATP-binding cassette domain-containing protein [Jatrophihabitans sp.]|nr:ATP-binding cassette domain-containing protein [Jatrophihabitans sp.]
MSAVGLAQSLWLLVAALGLALAVSYAGLPMLGQSAFLAVGGYGVLLLGPGGAGLPLGVAAGLAVSLAAAGGYLTALATARLDGGYLALATWTLAWLAQRTLIAFPDLFGGTEGITRAAPARLVSRTLGVQLTLTDRINLCLAAGSCLLILAALYRLGRGPAGLDLAGLRESPGLTASLGVAVAARRRAVLTTTAALGGLAGAGSAVLLGVISPVDVSPLLSLELLLAVLLGGTARWWGPVLGIAVLAALPGGALAPTELGGAPARAVLTALLLLAAVAARTVLQRRPRHDLAPLPGRPSELPPPRPARRGAELELSHASVRYAGVTALDGVSLTLRGGQVHALIGPNGSGKSTLLDVLAGDLDAGTVRLDGAPHRARSVPDRVRAGVVRTPQQATVLTGLSPARQVALGARGGAGWPQAVLRQLFGTPRSRQQAAELHAAVADTLDVSGLSKLADLDPVRLTAGERQLLQVARAVATGARVLLFDEPAAGMTAAERGQLQAVLRRLADGGAAVLIVEHDLRLVAAVADRITVLDAGRVLATGDAASVRADPAVRHALLGVR